MYDCASILIPTHRAVGRQKMSKSQFCRFPYSLSSDAQIHCTSWIKDHSRNAVSYAKCV